MSPLAAAVIPGLRASEPQPLPFAPDVEIRAFVLERPAGDVAIYSTGTLDLTGVARHYLNHSHEAMFPPPAQPAPLFVHEAERAATEDAMEVRATFTRRHLLDGDLEVIPTPGHTPGATAYLWDSGEHRMLFTGDSIYLDDGEWIAAVLASSDRAAYLKSLRVLRELEFDILVPWAAGRGEPYAAFTDREDSRRRIGAIIARLEAGGRR
jgi:glyoxylase-like metal-dependent hydrolase (beta-lactamase superfamily II)